MHDAETIKFRERGFVLLKDALSSSQVAEFRLLSDSMSAQAKRISSEALEQGLPLSHFASLRPDSLIVNVEKNEPNLVSRYEYMLGSNQAFRSLLHSAITPLVSAIVAEDVVVFKDKTNEKYPGAGGFGPHQDMEAYRHFSGDRFITVAISIHPSNVVNGCLDFAMNWLPTCNAAEGKARSREAMLLQTYPDGELNGEILADIAQHLRWSTVETTVSDLVLFDAFVPHRSAPNRGKSQRRMIFITYTCAAQSSHYEEYYSEKRANYADPKFHIATPTAR